MAKYARFGGLFVMLLAVQTAVCAGPVPGQGTWQTTLLPRDINRDGVIDAYFDTALNITWLANANAGAGSAFDGGGSNVDGTMEWSRALAWAASLDVYGVTGWTLPSTENRPEGCSGSLPLPTCGYGVDPASSQMAHMYFVTLGNLPTISPTTGQPVPGGGLVNSGPFANLRASNYWSSTPAAIDSSYAWLFTMSDGYQTIYRGSDWYAWAVRDGDVRLDIPEPGSMALTLLALTAVVAVGRRSRKARS